jgi:hypothetical protein
MQNQLNSNGDAPRRYGNGQIAAISFSNDVKGFAQQFFQAKAAAQNAGAANSPAAAPQMSTSVALSAA